MDYKPGDVANGHVLGSDLIWHPVSPNAEPAQTATGRGYLRRFLGRLPKTLGAWAVLFTLLGVVGALAGTLGAPEVILIVLSGTIFFGVPSAIFVALIPDRRN